MKVEYSDFLWGDSILKAIHIKYDRTSIFVYNEVAAQDILISCYDCVETSPIIVGEDWIIDSILLETIAAKERLISPIPFESIIELRFRMVSGQEYHFLCKSVSFESLSES